MGLRTYTNCCDLEYFDVPIGELNYRSEMPSTAVLINPDSFDMSALTEMKRKKFRLEGYPAKQVGMNCDEVRTYVSTSCSVWVTRV